MRKNCLLFVAIAAMALLFNACSNEEMWEDATPKVEEEAEGGEMGTKELGDGILGYGYDITEAFVGDNSVKRRILNIDQLLRNEAGNSKISCDTLGIYSTKGRSFAGENAVSLLEQTIKKTNFELSAASAGLESFLKSDSEGTTNSRSGLFSASIKYGNESENKFTYSSIYSYSVADVVYRYRNLFVESTDPSIFSKYLDSYFQENLKGLTAAKADEVIKKFGTHILLNITIGGYFRSYYKSSITNHSDYNRKKDIVEAGGRGVISNIAGVGANVSWEREEINSLSVKNKEWECEFECIGGTNVGLSQENANNDNPVKQSINYGTWTNSIDEKSARLVDVDWNGVFPIYEFVSDPTTKQLLKEAVIRYINSKKINMTDLIPVYSIWDPYNNNCFYTTSYSEYIKYPQNRPNLNYSHSLEKQGVIFYLLGRELENSIPIHRMYHEWGKNHIYLSAGTNAELQQYSTWTNYERTEGYAYKTKIKEGMIPIWGFYDSSGPNCILLVNPSQRELEQYRSWTIDNGIAFWAFPR